MNKHLYFVFAALVAMSGPSMAAGNAQLLVKTDSDKLENRRGGEISADTDAIGGAGESIAGQRVTAPLLTGSVTVDSRDNTFINEGRISAKTRVRGGAGSAIAGQDVIR